MDLTRWAILVVVVVLGGWILYDKRKFRREEIAFRKKIADLKLTELAARQKEQK